MKKKTILGIILLVVLLLTFSGCGNSAPAINENIEELKDVIIETDDATRVIAVIYIEKGMVYLGPTILRVFIKNILRIVLGSSLYLLTFVSTAQSIPLKSTQYKA